MSLGEDLLHASLAVIKGKSISVEDMEQDR
jgi:hypothetical protein